MQARKNLASCEYFSWHCSVKGVLNFSETTLLPEACEHIQKPFQKSIICRFWSYGNATGSWAFLFLDNEQHDKSQMDSCFPNDERSMVGAIKCLMPRQVFWCCHLLTKESFLNPRIWGPHHDWVPGQIKPSHHSVYLKQCLPEVVPLQLCLWAGNAAEMLQKVTCATRSSKALLCLQALSMADEKHSLCRGILAWTSWRTNRHYIYPYTLLHAYS